jgi:Rod binding domain-containing protein
MDTLALTSEGRIDPRSPGALRQATRQLEGVFLQMLYKQASDALPVDEGDDGVFAPSAATRQFTEMLHAALVERNAGSLGLAQVIERQLAGRMGAATTPPVTPAAGAGHG